MIRPLVASLVIGTAIAGSFLGPKHKYEGPRELSTVTIPETLKYWKSRDAKHLIDMKDRRYAFIGDVVVREYKSDLGENLLLLAMEAVNFHHPRGCFDSSGFVVHFIPPLKIETSSGKQWDAQCYFMEKGAESVLVVYWITIDGKVVNWAEQRWDQLAYTLLGKKKQGFMVRMDIPTAKERVESARQTAATFIRDLEPELPRKDSEKLFGRAEVKAS